MVAFRKNLNVPSSEYALRSLYMRLYRVRVEGVDFYPAECVDSAIDALLARGHAEAMGAGYRLTTDGVRAWADMNDQPLQTHFQPHSEHIQKRKVKHAMPLSPESQKVLEQLIEHEEGLPESDFDVRLNALTRHDYIKRMDGLLFITDKGRKLLNGNSDAARQPVQRPRKGLQTPVKPDVTRPPVNWQTVRSDDALVHSDMADSSDVRGDMVIDRVRARTRGVASDMVMADRVTEACAGDCGDCVHKRVLDMVADRLPEVRDLLAAVKAQDILLKSLARK